MKTCMITLLAVLVILTFNLRAQQTDSWKEWSDGHRDTIEDLIEQYGPPDETTESMVMWKEAGPWKRIVVHREGWEHNFPKPHKDYLEQTVNYKVPPDKFDELAQYDGSISANRTRGEISACCNREEMNRLTLNVCHDIITGKRDIKSGRDFVAKTVTEFAVGDKSEYTKRLLFNTDKADTGDPDESMIGKGIAESLDDIFDNDDDDDYR